MAPCQVATMGVMETVPAYALRHAQGLVPVVVQAVVMGNVHIVVQVPAVIVVEGIVLIIVHIVVVAAVVAVQIAIS